MTQVAAEIRPELAMWRLPGSTANPPVVAYLHPYFTEDRVLHGTRGQPSLFESGGWQQRIGVDPTTIWTSTVAPDLEAVRAYAAEVHASSLAALEALDPAMLERVVDTPFGKEPLANLLSLILVIHKTGHMGEIAALLGCQGIKGFPF